MKRILYFVFLIMLLSGCGQRKPVSQVHHFKNATWERFKHLNFELPVENLRQKYDLTLMLRYSDKFSENTLPVNVVIVTPEGEERIKEYTFFIKDNSGNFAGNPVDGVYEMAVTLRKEVRFGKKGMLKFEIENLNSKYYTPGVIEMVVVLEDGVEL